jgi:hypothetical protein
MKTYVVDDLFEKVVFGEMTVKEWMEQAERGSDISISSDEDVEEDKE